MNRRLGERGQTLPLMGLCFMVLMGVGAAVIDVSYLEYQQMRMQSAADAAAIAGAQQLITKGCPDQTDAATAADKDAQGDGFAPGANVTVTVDNPPKSLDGPYQGNNCAVYVNIDVPKTSDWFLKKFGAPTGAPVQAFAVALMDHSNPACIYLLNPSVVSSFLNATITASSCAILMNDTANFTSATIKASAIGYAGTAPSKSGATFPVATPTPMLPSQDPCPQMVGCASIAANPPSATGCNNTTVSSGTLLPGCFSNLVISGSVTLSAGNYVLNGTSNFAGGTLTGTGVTFYVTASGTPPNFSAASGGSLAAPSSGTYANVLYYQVPSNTSNPSFGGTGSLNTMSGLIYAPGATNVSYCCTTGQVVLVFGGASFASSVALPTNAVTIPGASTIIARVIMVE